MKQEINSNSQHQVMRSSGFHLYFVDGVKAAYGVENEQASILSADSSAVSSESLKKELTAQQERQKGHITQLENAFRLLNQQPEEKHCEAMDGMIKEASAIKEEVNDDKTRDVAVIASFQKMKHYGIASYGTLAAFARTMDQGEIAGILEGISSDEKEADNALSGLANSGIDSNALSNK